MVKKILAIKSTIVSSKWPEGGSRGESVSTREKEVGSESGDQNEIMRNEPKTYMMSDDCDGQLRTPNGKIASFLTQFYALLFNCPLLLFVVC